MENRRGTAAMNLKNQIIRKFIPLMAITASAGGLSALLLDWAGSEIGMWYLLLIGLAYIISGTVIGTIFLNFFQKRDKDIITRNVKGEPLIAKQPAYLIAALAIIAAFLINLKFGFGFAFLAGLLYGFNFLLGISNGIFDYRESVTKNLLYTGVLPVGLAFIYGYYIGHTDATISFAWFIGSLYLLCYLLFINRMQLDLIIFFRKSVNIEDSRKIRLFNDIMIFAFYSIFLIMFNFRNLIKISRDAIQKFIAWIFMVMEKISDFLIKDIPYMKREEKKPIDELIKGEATVRRPWVEVFMKILMYTLFAAVCIGLLIAIIGFIVKLVKKIRESMRLSYNRHASEKRSSSNEYEEESEIVVEDRNNSTLKSKKRKMHYNLRELRKIPLAGDKIRYVYGFVLERLYHNDISIEKSDTPEQILDKVNKVKNGEKLTKMGFKEFTENYERVRYGNKEISSDDNLEKRGADFEKAVSSMSEEDEKT